MSENEKNLVCAMECSHIAGFFFQASRHCLGNILDRYLIESLYRM